MNVLYIYKHTYTYILCRIARKLSAYNDFMLITLIIIIVFYVFITDYVYYYDDDV